MAEIGSSKKVVHLALAGDLLVAATKFIAAALTGGASLASEGVHSLVDAGNELLLLYGYRRAQRRPDETHPLGYGRELYFWSFVVSLLLFTLGAGFSIGEGVWRLFVPHPIEQVAVAYIVLALAAAFDGFAWFAALRAFNKAKGDSSYWRAIKDSKDPPVFMVLAVDSAALIGVAIAAVGISLASAFQNSVFDGVASILIGLLLAAVAWILARESKGLLVGEAATRDFSASLIALARSQEGVDGAHGATTTHLAPDQVVAALCIEFSDELRAPEIEEAVRSLERRVREKHPEVVALFVKPQTRRAFKPGGDAKEPRIARPLA